MIETLKSNWNGLLAVVKENNKFYIIYSGNYIPCKTENIANRIFDLLMENFDNKEICFS